MSGFYKAPRLCSLTPGADPVMSKPALVLALLQNISASGLFS